MIFTANIPYKCRLFSLFLANFILHSLGVYLPTAYTGNAGTADGHISPPREAKSAKLLWREAISFAHLEM